LRYLPPIASGHADGLMVAWGYVWSGLMFASAIANVAVAWTLPSLWPAYLATVPLASKLALFAIQYASIRPIVRRTLLAGRAALTQPVAASVRLRRPPGSSPAAGRASAARPSGSRRRRSAPCRRRARRRSSPRPDRSRRSAGRGPSPRPAAAPAHRPP